MTMLDFNDAPPLRAIDPQDWERRLDTLRIRLRDRARDMIETVFPRARIQGQEARIGGVDGAMGESLAISLAGDRAGLWRDHATGEGGDLIDLWIATQGYSQNEFHKAVEEMEQWCGLSQRPHWTSPVSKVAEARKRQADSEPKPDTSLGPPVGTWHYLSADGALLGIVRRYDLAGQVDAATGKPKKTFRPFNSRGEPKMPDPRPLYRLPNIKNASAVVLVEGEKCADALERVGVEATTAMGGAKADPAKTDWSPLAGKQVIVWEDNDTAGSGLSERVRPYLETLGCDVQVMPIPAGKPDKWDAADAVSAGEDVQALLAKVQPRTAPAPLRFRILSIDELVNVKPPEWRIDGVFPTHGSSTLYGAFETFKTFIALDMMLSLACGRDWQGRTIKPCSVLYVAGEGQTGLGLRVAGWLAAHGVERRSARFRGLPEAVALPTPGDQDDVLRAIDAMDDPPEVIVWDTVTRMTGGGSLNDEKDAQAYVRGMDRIRNATGAHMFNVGHSGKDKEKGILGSIVLPAAMETIICVERKGDNLTLINSNPKGKQKDGPNFEDIKLAKRTVEFDHQGDRLTTVILQSDDEVVTAEPAQRLGPLQLKIMTVLEQAARDGQTLGFTRMKMMVGTDDNGNLGKALRKLAEKGLIEDAGAEGNQQWKLA